MVKMAQVQTALGAVLRDASAKELPCGVFGSFGWSGEAVDELESRLRVRTPSSPLHHLHRILSLKHASMGKAQCMHVSKAV